MAVWLKVDTGMGRLGVEPAAVADQAILCFIQMNIALAFWACQDIQQFLTDRHL